MRPISMMPNRNSSSAGTMMPNCTAAPPSRLLNSALSAPARDDRSGFQAMALMAAGAPILLNARGRLRAQGKRAADRRIRDQGSIDDLRAHRYIRADRLAARAGRAAGGGSDRLPGG